VATNRHQFDLCSAETGNLVARGSKWFFLNYGENGLFCSTGPVSTPFLTVLSVIDSYILWLQIGTSFTFVASILVDPFFANQNTEMDHQNIFFNNSSNF